MNNLEKAYSQEGTGILYWCGYGAEIPPPVDKLLQIASTHNRNAFFIPTNGFDDLMKRIALYCLSDAKGEKARDLISQSENNRSVERTPFQISTVLPIQTIIKSNAFYIECPNDLYQFSLQDLPEEGLWRWLEEKSREKDFAAVPRKGKILAIGDIENIRTVFENQIIGAIERVPIELNELAYEDGSINSLFRRAIIKAISKTTNLHTDYKEQLWKRNAKQQYSDQGKYYNIYESAVLFLRSLVAKTHLIIKPSLRNYLKR
jgi:hypothetical protein